MSNVTSHREDENLEPIAVVGMGCRFPGNNNPDDFWATLKAGENFVTEIPSNRWDVDAFYDPEPSVVGKMNTRWGGFLDGVDQFDPVFFGISAREAEHMDPQQRLLLEVTWEALERAGIPTDQLAGSKTGVFIGVGSYDYHKILTRDVAEIGPYSALGTANCITASRIAYLLDLKGPNLSIDTGCSSSLVSAHYACQSLRSGESNMCLVGGVNVILSPEITVTFSQAHMMSADGQCKAFDADANGYVRGEGCGVVVLKRLSDAERDGDRVLAVIKGSAINHDGRTNGIAAPNSLSQQALIKEAIANAGHQPADVDYIEAHGTGTSLGDPIEFKAIRSTLLNDRADDQRCWIGSVKTNIGHLEAAAGIASLIKVVLSLQHEAIPPNLHFNQSNQYISLDNTPLGIPTTIQPWSIQEKERVAGINGYSFGGTNCHLVVAEAPRKKTPDRVIAEHSTPSVRPFLLSAKRADALIELAKRYETFLATNASDPDSAVALADVCFTANTGRAHYKHRLAIATESTAHLKQQLSHFVQGQQMSTVKHQVITGGLAPKVAFLFSGQGSQYINMGRELYESSPKFRACLERCDRILRPHLDCSIIDVIYRSVEAHAEEKLPLIDQTSYTQPCLFSLEYALAQQWLSWGIRPSVVMGHSLGEYVAACVAGAFTLEDALPLIATRARLMDALPQTGQMVAVFAPELAVKAALAAAGSSVVISAVNSPQSVVISGENQAVEQMANLFTQQQIEVRSLAVSQAFHSPLIAPMVDSLGEALKQVTIQPLRLPLASSLTGEVFGKGHILTTDYWQQHTLGAVRFMDGLNSVINQKCRVVIEIGPHPVLSRQGQRCNLDPAPHWLPSLVKQQGDWCNLSKSLAALYTYGVAVNWNAFEAKLPGERLCLPTYPFKRQSYWVKNANLPHYPYLSNTAPISGAAPTLQAVNTANGRGPYDHRNGHGHRNDNSHHNGNGHRNGSAPQHLQTQLVTPIEPPATVQLGPSVSQRKQTRKECILLHLQGQLAQMLRLDPSDIDVHDSLVEMGADSISLLEMVHALEATYGISFSMTELFRFSHLAAIAEHLDTTLAATWEMPGERAMATPEVTMDQPLASEIAQLSAQLSAQQLSAQQLSAQQISMTAWAIDERPHPPELTATVALLKQQLETLSQVMTAQMDTLNRVTGNERSSILPESLQQPAPSLSPDDAVGGHGFSQGKNKVQAQKQPQEQAQKQPQKQSEEKPLTVTFAARNRPLQLSHPQERLWFLAQLEGPSATYNIPVVLKIEGVLDRTAFEQSIQAIVDRHESLRTSFTTQNDQPIQQVHAAIDWGIKTVDLRADKIPMATAAKLIQTEVERPFDLTRLPLFRVTLIRIDELTTVLVFTIHHIISDAWSMGRVFVEELRQGYGDRIGHKAVNNNGHQPSGEARLPLRVQYADFAQWHRSWLQGPAGERQLSYWKTQLADLPSCLELPTDYPRPKVKTYQGDTVHQVIPPALVTQLTQLSQSSGVTLFMTLLSAYGLLLSRYSGQRDIVIGSPLVNRPYPELTPLIGFFLNTLALRLRLSPQSSFQTLLTHVKEQTLMAYDHPDVPFEEIVRALQLPRNTSHTPLFQTMFVFQNVAEETVDFPGLQMTPMKVNVKVSKFDLTLWLSQTDGQIRAEWEYSTDLFKASSIERMATHFQQLLESLVETPQCPISALSLIPAQEQQWLSQWGNHSWHNANQFTQGALAPDHLQQPIYEQIAAQAKKTPGAIALEWNQQTLTYAALDQQANQLAHYLTELGVTPGQRVGLCLPRSFALIVSILGILKVGAAYVPLDPNYPQARLDYIVTDAQLQALISLESTLSEKFAAAGDADYQLICYDRDREKITAQPTTCPVRPISTEGAIDNSQLAYLIYTSGSTGQPKGVAVGHSALSNFVQGAISHYGFIPSDRTLQFASISFDAAAEEIFPTLCVGATLVLRPNNMVASLGEFLRSCNELQLSILDLPTAYWQQLVGELTNTQNPAPKQTLPDQLRLVIIGGEKVSSESVRLWQQHMGTEPDSAATRITLLNTYGPTEATVVTTAYRIPNSLPDGDREIAVSTNVLIGKPLPNVEVYVLDSALQPVPIGVPGELYIGGAGLAQGYFNRPELTAKAFIPHPFSQQPGARLYKSGDRVRYQENGELAYLDRIDNQVKIRGFRIELGEVESVLAVLPQVKDVIVVTQTSEQGDRRLVAYVVAPADTAPAALRQHVKDQLPDYMVPTVFMVLDTFPLTPSGKVDRRNLPMPDQSDLRQGERYVAPQTPIECKLVEIVQTLLSLEKVGVEDDFFTIGGHSLLATQLMLKVQTEFQVDIPLTVLFETPTLANLAQHIEGHTNHQPASAAPEDAAPSAVVVSALDAKSSKPETLLGTRPIPVIERDRNSIPLSYAQQRLWFLQALEPESTAYTLPGGIRLQGRLNPTALERALATIVERHEALRTTFDYQDGRPVQRIEPSGTWMLSSTDFSDLDSTAQAKALEKLIEKTVQQPFDLTRDALLRCQLVTLSAQDHVLLFCTHHISSDGWSINLLLRELVTLYEDFCAGRAASLPLLPIQYADFTVWQREWLQGEVLQQQLDYWQKQLEGAPALLELPTDRPRPAVQTVNGARLYHRLPHDLTEQLDQLSQRVGGTLFMVLLTGFNLLLSRYSSQLDISVGSTIANRPHLQLTNLIGVFLNTLVLRSDLSGDPTVVDLLKRVKTTALEAYRYQNVPFEQVDALNPAREMSHSRLFQVMFILQNTPGTLTGEAMTMPSGLSIRQLDLERGVSPFDITLSMDTMDGQLVGKWEYNRDLFNESTIQQMTGHFQQLLESMVNAPEKPISQLSMLTSAERSRLLPPQQTYSTPHLNAGCIHTLFEQQVAQTPDAIAVEHPSGSLTYAALNQLANQLAHHLASLGIEPDGLVGLCVARSPQMLIGVLGILKAGAAYVPLDPHYPQARLDYMVKDANIAVVVTTNSAASNLSLPASIQQIRLDTAWDSVISQQPTINPTQPVKANHLAYVIYTSGSTGQPKGVLIEHRSLVSFAQGAIQAYGFTAEDKVLQFASLNFDTAAEEIYPCLLSGGTLVLRTESAAGGLAALGEVCQQWQLTVLDLPTAYWQQLVAEATKQKQAKQDQAEQNQSEQDPNNFLTNLRLVIIGGEKVAVESVAQWQQLMATRPNAPRLLNTYGPTETTVVATLYEIPNQPEAERLGQEIAIGKPLPNVDVYVLDNRQRLVPVGVPGELYIGGPGVARGYLNRPEQTAKAFVASPFDDDRLTRLYKTGDRVRYLPDGNLEYLGRFDHQVKIRGFRIELGEIETALAQQPGIQQSLVMVREDNPGHPQIVAYAVLAESATVNQAVDQKANQKAKRNDLRTALKRRLPDYMVPSVFMFLEEFPLTPNGKVDRHSLPVPDQADLRQDQEYVAPRTETEAELVQIVQDVLGLEKVGVEDNFFEIGGHSLLATQVIVRVQDYFHIDIALRSVFERPTIAVLAQQIEQQQLGQVDANEMDQLLSELDGLSEAEIADLLT